MRGSFKDAANEAVEFDGSLSGLVKVIDRFYKDDPVMAGFAREDNVEVLPHPQDESGKLHVVTVDKQGIGFITDGPLVR